MESKNLEGFGIGLVAGVIIGGVITLLYAPKSGAETRQLIKERAVEAVETLKEGAGEVIDKVKETASELERKGQGAIKGIKG